MAEFLIKAIDAIYLGSLAKDKRGSYKRGDVVVVMPDGHVWGKEEKLPKFIVMKISNLDVNAAKKYINSHDEPRIQVRRWNKLAWDNVQVDSKFLSKPIEIGQEDKMETFNVPVEQWIKMKEKNDYAPFIAKPIESGVLIGRRYRLTGIVRYIDLQGDVMTTIIRRKFRILVDGFPNVIKQELKTKGEVTLRWVQIRNFIENKVTGVTE